MLSSATIILGADSSDLGGGPRGGIVELRLKASGRIDEQLTPAMVCGGECEGAFFEVLKTTHGGSSCAVRLPRWHPGGRVTVVFPSPMTVSKVYHASIAVATPTAVTFALENKPNPNGAFQFSATGAATTAVVSCGGILSPPPPHPPPPPSPPPPPWPPRPPPPPDTMPPEKVSGALVVAARCDSLVLNLREPRARGQRPTHYVIAPSASSAAASVAALMRAKVTCQPPAQAGVGTLSCIVGPLQSSTAYTFTLAGANGAGVGAASHPLSASTTPSPEGAPVPMAAPVPLDAPDCTSIRLQLPPRQAGCRPDTGALVLYQRAGAGPWRALLEQPTASAEWRQPTTDTLATATALFTASSAVGSYAAGTAGRRLQFGNVPAGRSGTHGVASSMVDETGNTSVLIRFLERYTAYQYLLSSSNDRGTTLGTPSRPWLTDVTEASLRRAPHAEASGSASFTVSWVGQASHCRPTLKWRLETRHKGAPKWQTVVSEATVPLYVTDELRCPAGCAFRVTPTNIVGWADAWASFEHNEHVTAAASAASNVSAFIPSDFLPSLRAGAVRLELSFSRAAGTNDVETARGVKADMATTVGAPAHRLAVVEVRGHGRFVVLDLLPATDVDPTAEDLASNLVDSIMADTSALYTRSVTRALDPRAGVLRLAASGATTQLLSQAQLSNAATMGAGVRAAADAEASRKMAAHAAAAAVAARTQQFAAAAAEEEAVWWRTYAGGGGGLLGSMIRAIGVLVTLIAAFGLLMRRGGGSMWCLPLFSISGDAGARYNSPAAAASAVASHATFDSVKRVDIAVGAALNGSGGAGTAACGHLDVREASTSLELLELVASLCEELLDAPLSESAQLICIDSSGGEQPFTAADDLDVALRAAALRVDAPPRKRGLFGAKRPHG